MNAIEHAVSAIQAATNGDTTTALEQISSAQRHAPTAARRDRQIVQIAALFVTGQHERATGLALEHVAQFPSDAELLTPVARPPTATSDRDVQPAGPTFTVAG